MKRITQKQAQIDLELHQQYIDDPSTGQRLDWSDCECSGLSLDGASFKWASLNRASLNGASLNGASFKWASLKGVSLDGASLNEASLERAFLDGASLDGASFNGAIGNMREIKSAQFDNWPCVWSCSPEGITTLNIGCQSHDLEKWRSADPLWIYAMAYRAPEWWAKYGAILLALVDASPAVPWGNAKAELHSLSE